MDKKSKFNQPFTKGTVSDTKKSQDVAGGKVYPKTSRKREPAGANFSKNDQNRKFGCGAQKTKNFDKRPIPKKHNFGSREVYSKAGDLEVAEYSSAMNGNKKPNFNHLLNFQYAPRDVQGGSTWSNRSSNTRYKYKSGSWFSVTQRHKYKELFLQANCQFVVAKNGNYSTYLQDADAVVEWDLVEQIRFHTFGELTCPICLNTPTAAKITRCGHVYCWHCILHYLQISERDVVKCPLCEDFIHKSDLKSVLGISQDNMNIGDKITLRLMRRQKGSLIATEVPEEGDLNLSIPRTFFSILENENCQNYSRLLLADTNDISNIIERERVELEFALAEDADNSENCFIQQALEELYNREKNLWKSLPQNVTSNATIEVEKNNELSHEFTEDGTQITEKTNNNDDSSATVIIKSSVNLPKHEEKYYYFYQSTDGQNIYLHAMNVKMLEQQYESLEKCPRLISGKLLEIETKCLTADLRHRLNFLSHLPLNCPFELVEIEMRNPLVSKEVLHCYKQQINHRQRQRKDRENEERRREKKITEEENKLMGKYPIPEIKIESQFHFPDFQPEILYAETNERTSPEIDISHLTKTPASVPEVEASESLALKSTNNQSLTRSFAQTVSNAGPSVISNNNWPVAGTSSRSTSHVEAKQNTLDDDDYCPKPKNMTVFDFIVLKSSGKKSKKRESKAKNRDLDEYTASET